MEGNAAEGADDVKIEGDFRTAHDERQYFDFEIELQIAAVVTG
jgi:hypothetical protein